MYDDKGHQPESKTLGQVEQSMNNEEKNALDGQFVGCDHESKDLLTNTILDHIKIVVPLTSARSILSLERKAAKVVFDDVQFRKLKDKMSSSGLLINEGIHQILPILVNSQYKEMPRKKKAHSPTQNKEKDQESAKH